MPSETLQHSTVINKKLFNILIEKFGDVGISNKGQKPRFEKIKKPNGKTVWIKIDAGEQYAVNCPFCGDTKKHLYISSLYGCQEENTDFTHLAHCKKCNALSHKDNRTKLKKIIFGNTPQLISPTIAESSVGTAANTELLPVMIPAGCIPIKHLPQNHPAIKHLTEKRKYDQNGIKWLSDVFEFYAYVSTSNKSLTSRIIIPIWFDDRRVGWLARTWVNNVEPKYYNLPGTPFSKIVYNYDRAKEYTKVILVEGVFDALKLMYVTKKYNVIALFGKSLSSYKENLIKNTWKQAVIILDADAAKDAEQIANKLSGVDVQIVKLTKGDPDAMQCPNLIRFLATEAT